MTRNTIKKCSLYIEVNNQIDYSISPVPESSTKDTNLAIHDFLLDVSKTHTIKIYVDELPPGMHLRVVKVLVNGIPISTIKHNTFFVTKDKKVKKTFGWIDEAGTFYLKMHSNIVSQNFLHYLLDLTATKN